MNATFKFCYFAYGIVQVIYDVYGWLVSTPSPTS